MNKFLLLFLIVTNSVFAKPLCGEKLIITANKTDMKNELKKYKEKGWKTKGHIRFKEYSFQQRIVKKCG